MAVFPRVRAFGLWTDGSVVLPSEMEIFDAHQSKAINGAEGGVYAPDDPVEIGGTGGLKVTGPFIVTSAAQLQGGATITGDLAVTDDVSVQGDAAIQGALDVDGLATVDQLAVVNGANIQGNAAVQGALAVTGNIGTDGDVFCERVAIHGSHLGSNILSVNGAGRITGNCEINGAFACDGAASFGNNVSIAGTLSVTSTLTVTGNTTFNGVTKAKGRFKRRVLTMTDAATTVSVADYDLVYVSASVLTAARALIISTTGAEEGDVLRVITKNSTHSVDVDWGEGGFSYIIASDKQQWLEVTFIGGVWIRTAFGDRITLPCADALDLGARKTLAARFAVRAKIAVLTASRRPRRSCSTARAASVHIAGRAGPVARAVRLAGLRALAASGASTLDLLARGARLGGLGVVFAASDEGEEEKDGQEKGAHGRAAYHQGKMTLSRPRQSARSVGGGTSAILGPWVV